MTQSRHLIAPKHTWTPAEVALVRAEWPTTTAPVLATRLGLTVAPVYKMAKQLGLQKTPGFWASPASGRLTSVQGAHTRFPPGNVPWSLGQRGVQWSVATQFKPGQAPPNVHPVGALRINGLGDIDIKLAPGPRQWLSLRRYVWQQAHGPIPPGMCIIMLNHDPHDTQLHNLKLVTRADNVRHNLLARYPAPVRSAMQLNGRLKNTISQLQKETSHD